MELAATGILAAVILTSCKSVHSSPELDREELLTILSKVSDWQIANFSYIEEGSIWELQDYGIASWTNATLYWGMLKWTETAPVPDKYLDWLTSIGEKRGWSMPANFVKLPYGLHHADELCVGQFYLGMYDRYHRPEMIAGAKERVDAIMADPPSPAMNAHAKQSWTWCDALFMAPPVYAELAALENDPEYLVFMDTLFKRTYNHLYNPADGLFFRDDTFFGKQEANGKNIYWGRGNGWVAAGLTNTLTAIPPDSPYRPFYEDLFRRLVGRLVSLQDVDGSWHASLLDPDSYPAPETSATALIVYAIAWGVNNGLLDAKTHIPVVMKGWSVLAAAVDADGKVNWIQPIGSDPKSVTRDMTAVYGVGAVLAAGTEIYKMTDNS